MRALHSQDITKNMEMVLTSNYARPMNNNDLAFNFLTKALELDEIEADEASPHVTT